MNSYEYEIKIICLGSSAIGKTSYINRLVKNIFLEGTIPTIGIDYNVLHLNVHDLKIRVILNDSNGHVMFRNMYINSIKKCTGIILFYDITDTYSLKEMIEWFNKIRGDLDPKAAIMLVGLKSDLSKEKLARKEAIKIAEKEKIGHFEVSAKTGENIELSFNFFVIEVLNKTFSLNMINEFYQEMKNLMESEIDIPIGQLDHNQNYDKSFFYGNEFFPFNFTELLLNSRYFYVNRNRYEKESVIDISKELSLFSDEISHESIEDFILYCKNKDIKLAKSNVIDLYWISIKFEVFHLISKVKNYISQNYFGIIKDFLEDRNKYNSFIIEKVIADHFINLIEVYKEQLMKLHISILYRIISYFWDK